MSTVNQPSSRNQQKHSTLQELPVKESKHSDFFFFFCMYGVWICKDALEIAIYKNTIGNIRIIETLSSRELKITKIIPRCIKISTLSYKFIKNNNDKYLNQRRKFYSMKFVPSILLTLYIRQSNIIQTSWENRSEQSFWKLESWINKQVPMHITNTRSISMLAWFK